MKRIFPKAMVGLALCMGICALGYAAWRRLALEKGGLPYDRTNPVVYDNDGAVDMYTDEYLLALSALGEIHLKGMMTSSPIAPYDRYVTAGDYERGVADREQLVGAAGGSGLTDIPTRMRGPMGNLERPSSGRIEDTRPIGAAGSWLIVNEARKASVEKPLVVVSGAPLTAEADAYLLDPSIADKVVIAWLGGQTHSMCDYNGWADPWAAYIVLKKMRLVQFPLGVSPPRVPKPQLLTLPPSPLRDYMYHKHHPTNSDPRDIDGDGAPAISLMRRDYPQVVRHVGFRNWTACRMHPAGEPPSEVHKVPALYPTLMEKALVVEESEQSVSTNEWWGTMRKALGH
jgi:hypothetical protein